MFAPKNILVPTDFSVYAGNALKQAIDLAKQYNARIFLLHVIDDGFQQCAVDYCLDQGNIQRILKESVESAEDKLQEEVKKISDDNTGIEIVCDAIRGIPYEEIIKEQEDKGIDMIVISSYGKTGILKNLLGGVVDKVMKRAKCPVLLVRN